MNPPRRHVLAANQITPSLAPFVDTISDLKAGRHYKPLTSAMTTLKGSRILVERHRDRGIGDMLFMTGPLSYISHMAGGAVHIDMYGLVDRSAILHNHPALTYGGVMSGPILYDDLPLYNYHWFSDSVTEYDETSDQLNVYDALYAQLGIDPKTVPPKFKRPSLQLSRNDFSDLDSLYHMVASQRNIDLRSQPYYVLSPVSYSSLRVAPYSMWLSLAQELSKKRPVIFAGHMAADGQMPAAGMSFGQFYQAAGQLGPRVLNLIGNTSIRVIAALISRALAVVSLDSGLLYVAQALNTPAVSLWGTHSPVTRIGYDNAYMRYAIHKRSVCPASPCYAYAGFPYSRCARGVSQVTCEPLAAVTAQEIIAKIGDIERDQLAVVRREQMASPTQDAQSPAAASLSSSATTDAGSAS